MPSQITVTSKTGPGLTVTSQVFNPIQGVNFRLAPKSVLEVVKGSGEIVSFDIAATTTITFTISAGVGTITLSQ